MVHGMSGFNVGRCDNGRSGFASSSRHLGELVGIPQTGWRGFEVDSSLISIEHIDIIRHIENIYI